MNKQGQARFLVLLPKICEVIKFFRVKTNLCKTSVLNKNTGIPLETVAEMRDRLKLSSSNSEIIVHPNAPTLFLWTTAIQKLILAGNVSKRGLRITGSELNLNLKISKQRQRCGINIIFI